MKDLEHIIAENYLAKQAKLASKANSERASVIQEFVEELNAERKGTKWKPVHPRAIAVKLGHIKKLSDLYYFLGQCRKYKAEGKGEFGRCFFGSLKVR